MRSHIPLFKPRKANKMRISQKDIDILSRSLLFRNMTTADIEETALALHMTKNEYLKDEYILTAGDITDRLCMVLSGSVIVESNDLWGNRTILANIKTPGFFAEVFAILKDEPVNVDVRANENCSIAFFDMAGLQLLMQDSPQWLVKLLHNLMMISVNRNLLLSGRSLHTSSKSARRRIMAYLTDVSLKAQTNDFLIPFDRQQMADYLNLERTALSKELGKMRDEGLLDFRKNHFILYKNTGDQL